MGLRGQEAEVAGGAVRVEQVGHLRFEAALDGARRGGEPGMREVSVGGGSSAATPTANRTTDGKDRPVELS